ncbi:spore coat protein [Paenibacillus crassostreae]|uniref:Spore coat protein n=1 Tax=Paenibacillus crassostreae TaxID=1763538 RepID=A0A167AQZ5_9BACL|nr:spore coat protein [Paenibacillus crassostreae]AOZ94770.1 spore coat protein [Paenibacillus crassostreae]OAB71334.1 spore coat protein [Paenibacillus crassostreae]
MKSQQQHLAWHETLEMHELTAYQSNQLIHFKMVVNDIKDPQLHALYMEAIKGVEKNLKELLQYFPMAPQGTRGGTTGVDLTAFYAGQLLGFAKTSVRSYAIAITETATPALRDTFQKQLNAAIQLHGKIYYFMLERGLYPSYDLPKLLSNDVAMANKAISL